VSGIVEFPVKLEPKALLGFGLLVVAAVIVAKRLPVVGKQL